MPVKYPDRKAVAEKIHALRALGKLDRQIAAELRLTPQWVIDIAGRRRDDPSVQRCEWKETGNRRYKGGRGKRVTIRCTPEFDERLRELARRSRQGGVRRTMADVLDWLVQAEFESPRLLIREEPHE